MADNVGYTPGTGEIIATDDISGVQYQKVKITLGTDNANDGLVSTSNPLPATITNTVNVTGDLLSQTQLQATLEANALQNLLTDTQLRASALVTTISGEVVEALEAVRMGLQSLLRSMGQFLPDTANRMRVNIETGILPSVTTVTTVATVTTVSNQTNVGGFSGTEHIPSLMKMAADSLRRNITVS